jgi:hypothetical protein
VAISCFVAASGAAWANVLLVLTANIMTTPTRPESKNRRFRFDLTVASLVPRPPSGFSVEHLHYCLARDAVLSEQLRQPAFAFLHNRCQQMQGFDGLAVPLLRNLAC